jgi:hypothetical protein
MQKPWRWSTNVFEQWLKKGVAWRRATCSHFAYA